MSTTAHAEVHRNHAEAPRTRVLHRKYSNKCAQFKWPIIAFLTFCAKIKVSISLIYYTCKQTTSSMASSFHNLEDPAALSKSFCDLQEVVRVCFSVFPNVLTFWMANNVIYCRGPFGIYKWVHKGQFASRFAAGRLTLPLSP